MLNEHEECYEYSCYTTSKKGFRNSDLCAYEVAIPTFYEAKKWLIECHRIHITILCDWDKVERYSYYLSVCDNDNNVDIKPYTRYSDYNECVNSALTKALNRI